MSNTPGWPSMPTLEERPRRRKGWLIIAILLLVVGGAAVAKLMTASDDSAQPAASRAAAIDDTMARAPSMVRVRVRVLNAAGTRGLGRRATTELRDRGFDVVEYDNDNGAGRASTLIEVHTGHDEWATRLQRALGTGKIERRPDSLRFVDLTVRVGRDWKPTAEALRP